MKTRNPFVAAAIAATLAVADPISRRMRAARAKFNRDRHFGHWTLQGRLPHRSKRECERRVRQIRRGQLTDANGLTMIGLNARHYWFDGTRINKPGRPL